MAHCKTVIKTASVRFHQIDGRDSRSTPSPPAAGAGPFQVTATAPEPGHGITVCYVVTVTDSETRINNMASISSTECTAAEDLQRYLSAYNHHSIYMLIFHRS